MHDGIIIMKMIQHSHTVMCESHVSVCTALTNTCRWAYSFTIYTFLNSGWTWTRKFLRRKPNIWSFSLNFPRLRWHPRDFIFNFLIWGFLSTPHFTRIVCPTLVSFSQFILLTLNLASGTHTRTHKLETQNKLKSKAKVSTHSLTFNNNYHILHKKNCRHWLLVAITFCLLERKSFVSFRCELSSRFALCYLI